MPASPTADKPECPHTSATFADSLFNPRIPDAQDALNRAHQILDFLISTRSDAEADCHPGETWVLDVIADAINQARFFLNPAPVVDPETIEAAAQKERIDRAVAESITIHAMKAAIAAHEARQAGGGV